MRVKYRCGYNKFEFQLSPLHPTQMIVLPPLLMHMLDEDNSVKPKLGRNLAYSFLNSITYTFSDKNATIKDNSICKDHDHEVLKPHLTSTWMPNSVGSMSGKSVVFAESEVSRRLLDVMKNKQTKKSQSSFELIS